MKYRKNYLTHVIFQLRFDPLRELESREMAEYGERIRTLLPKVNLLQRMHLTATISPQEPPSMKTEKAQTAWRFQAEDESKTLTVAPDQFALEYVRYEDIDATERDFRALWSPFLHIYPVKVLDRVGLRYVNQILLLSGQALDWDGWLAEGIVAATLKTPEPAALQLARSMHVVVWKGDDYGVRCQFGINNSDFPNAITKREFILDYDCYTVGATEISEVERLLQDYNRTIEGLFERSIAQKLKDEMGVIEG